jgi:UTP-glucose-1-phosphate uridylyltransferase
MDSAQEISIQTNRSKEALENLLDEIVEMLRLLTSRNEHDQLQVVKARFDTWRNT